MLFFCEQLTGWDVTATWWAAWFLRLCPLPFSEPQWKPRTWCERPRTAWRPIATSTAAPTPRTSSHRITGSAPLLTQRPYPSITLFCEGRRSGTTRTTLVYTAGWTNSSAAGKCLISSRFLDLLKRADIDLLLSCANPGFGCFSENKGSDRGMLF